MRKLTGAVFQSLDGVMQAPGGPDEDPTSGFRFGGWSFHFWDESLEKPFGKVIDGRLRPAARQADLRHLLRFLAQQPGQSDRRAIPAHQQICADPFGRAADLGAIATSSAAMRRRQLQT